MHVLSFVLLIPGRTSTQPAAEFRPFNLPERTMETMEIRRTSANVYLNDAVISCRRRRVLSCSRPARTSQPPF